MREWLIIALFGCSPFAWAQTSVTLRPTADGTVKQWTNNAGTLCTSATCYTEVNEASGSTNCASSAFVKGSGVYNKSPASTAQTERYGVGSALQAAVPNGAIIDSITVHACEARGGSTNTTGNLRIVFNGGTSSCASNQSVTATYADLSCTFSPLNVVKDGSTTLEIGNATQQNRSIWMDAISAVVTYRQQATQSPSTAFGVSPDITVNVTVSAPNTTGAAASAEISPVCCVTTGYPLNASVHFSPVATASRVTHKDACCIQENPHIDAQCSTCVQKQFFGASFRVIATASASRGVPSIAVAASANVSPVVVAKAGRRGLATSAFGVSPATAVAHPSSAPIGQPIRVAVSIGIDTTHVPQDAQRAVDVGFGMTDQVDHSAITSNSVTTAAHFVAAVIVNAQVFQSPSASVSLVTQATAVGSTPKRGFVMVVSQ